jgi:hypothetical protein
MQMRRSMERSQVIICWHFSNGDALTWGTLWQVRLKTEWKCQYHIRWKTNAIAYIHSHGETDPKRDSNMYYSKTDADITGSRADVCDKINLENQIKIKHIQINTTLTQQKSKLNLQWILP